MLERYVYLLLSYIRLYLEKYYLFILCKNYILGKTCTSFTELGTVLVKYVSSNPLSGLGQINMFRKAYSVICIPNQTCKFKSIIVSLINTCSSSDPVPVFQNWYLIVF